MGTPKIRNGTSKFLSIRQRLNPFLANHLCTIWIEFDKMAHAAQRAIQRTIIVWFLKKRRAKTARMIEEKRSSFLYIYNRQRRYYFGQLLLACINQPRLRTFWMNSQTRFFHSFFLTQERPTFQTTPFCLLKNMCACAAEFELAGWFFGETKLFCPAVSARLSFGHAGRWNLLLHGKIRSTVA